MLLLLLLHLFRKRRHFLSKTSSIPNPNSFCLFFCSDFRSPFSPITPTHIQEEEEKTRAGLISLLWNISAQTLRIQFIAYIKKCRKFLVCFTWGFLKWRHGLRRERVSRILWKQYLSLSIKKRDYLNLFSLKYISTNFKSSLNS